jgi:hypothetical protein
MVAVSLLGSTTSCMYLVRPSVPQRIYFFTPSEVLRALNRSAWTFWFSSVRCSKPEMKLGTGWSSFSFDNGFKSSGGQRCQHPCWANSSIEDTFLGFVEAIVACLQIFPWISCRISDTSLLGRKRTIQLVPIVFLSDARPNYLPSKEYF